MEVVGRKDVPRVMKDFFWKHPRFAFLEPMFEGLTHTDIFHDVKWTTSLTKCVAKEDYLRAEACIVALERFVELNVEKYADIIQTEVQKLLEETEDGEVSVE